MIKLLIMSVVMFFCITNVVTANHLYKLNSNYELHQSLVLVQLKDITINGITADQAYSNALEKAKKDIEYAKEHAYDDEEYNKNINRYNYLAKLHKELCNITSRTSFTIHSNIFDFIKIGDRYIHWLPFGSSEETCEHYSYNEMMRHAEIYNELLTLYYSIIEKKRSLTYNSDAKIPEIYRKCISEALAPYTEVLIKEYDKKSEEYNKGLKRYKCQFCRGHCHLSGGINQYELVGFICACGHPEFSHKFQ